MIINDKLALIVSGIVNLQTAKRWTCERWFDKFYI